VEMKRVGEQFEGEYIVSHVIHTFSMEGGYITEFGLKRNTLNAGTGRRAAPMQASSAQAAPVAAAVAGAYGDDEDEDGSEVYSLMWRKEGARTEKVSGGEKVVLYCKVKDIADGEKAKFAVYKEGGDGEAVAELEGEVRNGVAEAEWETPAEACEYRFEAEYGGASSDECAVLEVDGIELCSLAWMNGGKEISEALVDDEVSLYCEAKNIPDGEDVTFSIFEQGENKDDPVEEVTGTVADGKVEAPWKVICKCDEGSNIADEIEEQGYTEPNYCFTTKYGDIKSNEQSKELIIGAFVYCRLYNELTKENLANMDCELHLPDGSTRKCKSDSRGFVKVERLLHGKVTISLDMEGE